MPHLYLNEIKNASPMIKFITISYLFNYIFIFIYYNFWIYPLGFFLDAYKLIFVSILDIILKNYA